jgi:hypothetical protein
VNAFNGGAIVDGQGLATITNDDATPNPTAPTVVAIRDLRAIGSPDPSGLAYIPTTGSLFLCDSEHEESPFFSPINLYSLRTNGTLIQLTTAARS